MAAYYNEIDPYAAAWLRNLIEARLIAPGEVDERSIEDITPDDLRGFRQCHFFAGIGVWSYALRRAGWSDDRAVWTGSCPCQPFSAAGKRGGTADERHLWPAFFHLIHARRPAIVLGEQVASKDGLNWLDLVSADMEGAGYAFGATDLCAAGVGAPHIRQRLWFVGVADTIGERGCSRQPRREDAGDAWVAGEVCRLADSDGGNACAEGLQRSGEHGQQPQDGGVVRMEHDQGDGRIEGRAEPERGSAASRCSDVGVGNATGGRPQHESGGEPAGIQPQASRDARSGAEPSRRGASACERSSPTNGFWRDADWLLCRDERWRPVEPGTFPLAHGAPARVGRLRAYGNAIVAEAAREFIEAVDWSIGGDLA